MIAVCLFFGINVLEVCTHALGTRLSKEDRFVCMPPPPCQQNVHVRKKKYNDPKWPMEAREMVQAQSTA